MRIFRMANRCRQARAIQNSPLVLVSLAYSIEGLWIPFCSRGPRQEACLCRELTKLHEEYIRGGVNDILLIAKQRQLKGECVLVLAGSTAAQEKMSEAELTERLESMLNAGARLKESSGLLAKESGWSASDIYKMGLRLREKSNE